MTQQQIAYINAQTNKRMAEASMKQADAAMRQADASMSQARTAERRRSWDQSVGFGAELGTGFISTVGGLLALAFL